MKSSWDYFLSDLLIGHFMLLLFQIFRIFTNIFLDANYWWGIWLMYFYLSKPLYFNSFSQVFEEYIFMLSLAWFLLTHSMFICFICKHFPNLSQVLHWSYELIIFSTYLTYEVQMNFLVCVSVCMCMICSHICVRVVAVVSICKHVEAIRWLPKSSSITQLFFL